MGAAPRYLVINKLMARILGLLMPVMREMVEMMYQYDRDYVFCSSKFEQRFDFGPTPYHEGIQNVVSADYNKI